MRDAQSLQGRNGKSQCYRGNAQSQRKGDRTTSHEKRYGDTGKCQRQNRPPSRFAISGEIDHDAEAEGDREPRHQAARCNLGGQPLRNQVAQRPGGVHHTVRQQETCGASPGVDLRRPSLSAPSASACSRSSALGILPGQGAVRLPTLPVTTAPIITQPQVVATALLGLWTFPSPTYRAAQLCARTLAWRAPLLRPDRKKPVARTGQAVRGSHPQIAI